MVGSQSDVDGVKRTGVLRSINREKLNYDILTDELSSVGTLRAMIYQNYKQLLSIRKNEKAFNPYAKFSFLDLGNSIFCIRRWSPDEKEEILAINNFSDTSTLCLLPDFVGNGAYELIKNEKIVDKNIQIQPYQVLWIKYNKEEK